jgi:hypothetical protein
MIVIEVCERLMDACYVPVTRGRELIAEKRPKYQAQVKDQPNRWGAGTSREDAIGALIRNNPEFFGVQITDVGKQAR